METMVLNDGAIASFRAGIGGRYRFRRGQRHDVPLFRPQLREEHHILDGGLIGKSMTGPIDPDTFTGRGRHAVFEARKSSSTRWASSSPAACWAARASSTFPPDQRVISTRKTRWQFAPRDVELEPDRSGRIGILPARGEISIG